MQAYASHIVEASKASMVEIPSREVEKALRIAWLNIVCHIEDEASSVSDKKVEWYSNHHDNLTNVRMAENKASMEQDHRQKADEKLAQATLKSQSLRPRSQSSNKSLLSCRCRTKECQSFGVTCMISWVLIQNPLLADRAGKGRRARHSCWPSDMGASS